MSELIRSISGIRGLVGDTLTPQDVARYGAAFARLCGDGPVVVGYDGRPSGLPMKDLLRSSLLLCGRDVIDVGLAPTPTVQLVTEKRLAAGGIAITASHNPSEWNGMKFVNARGIFLDAAENAKLFAIADAGDLHYAPWNALGVLTVADDAMTMHLDAVLDNPLFDVDAIRARAFRVVVDAVNASGSRYVPALLARLGCDVVSVACDGTGVFPHMPEPLPENLTSLGDAVRVHGADLGIAVDPDADRLVLFDERGNPFGEEYTVTTAVDGALARLAEDAPRIAVVNLSTTRAVDDVAARHGATVLRTPVGEINVVTRMLATGAAIGGEGSGGVIAPGVHAGRDSLVGIGLVLGVLAKAGLPSSAYRASLPDYVIRKKKFPLRDMNAAALLDKAAHGFPEGKTNTEDGVRIDFAEGWVHLRTSNTEPIIRLIAEAPTADAAEALAERIERFIFT